MSRRPSPLILVSNRGPVTFGHGADGEVEQTRGGGGLVTALLGLAEHTPALWVSAAISEADEAVSAENDGGSFALPDLGIDTRGRFVVIDPETYHQYYNVVANPMLWFIQHYLWDLSNAPDVRREELDAWDNGYLAANRAFAEAVNRELDDDPERVVMLHDYHLYTAPEQIREAHPDVFLHHFIHIPWSQPDYWRILPPHIREGILKGLLANDVIAFHTHAYSRNFLLCCEDLLDLQVDYAKRQVRWEGRDVWVRSYPISVNAPMFEALASAPETLDEEAALLRRRRQYMVVRVDRTDLSKNTLRGFKAFDVFLDRHPEFLEDITFFALLQPTRQDVEEYVEYLAKIRDVVSHVNLKHGTPDWMPIDLRIESNIHRAVAAYKNYDVLVVNPIFDGMNLIAKEAPLVNERDGVLILSENAGAHEELGAYAITINPFDVDAQAEALHQALTMPHDERAFRGQEIKRIVRENDVGKWLQAQQDDITRKRAADRRRTRRAGA